MYRLALLFLSLLVLFSSAAADSGDPPFLEMLSRVPISAASLESVSVITYVDYRAVEAARPNVPTPQSWAEWAALDREASSLWLANANRIQSGPPEIFQYLTVLESMPQVMGFDVFDIDRALTFGDPPGTGYLYGGDFDLETLAAAHTARGYTQTEYHGMALWCGAVGCENGFQQNLRERDQANIFGGDLGRAFPFSAEPNYLYVSGDLANVQKMIDTVQGDLESVLDVPAYLAAADASTRGGGLLIQAQILSPIQVGYMPNILDPTDYEAYFESIGNLPPYELAALVDKQDGSDQLAMIVLVYGSEDDAIQAAVELTERLETFAPFSGGDEPVLTRDSINGKMDEPTVYFSEAAGKWAAIAAARYPMPDNERYDADGRPSEDGMLRASGQVFRVWIQALFRREFTPLLIKIE